ncbi:MAG TPA: hypothetical protein VD970_06585 [Acetobacteraceae bacterium]|nr:hypothetical protein [Acetobacteraceae bacterium]
MPRLRLIAGIATFAAILPAMAQSPIAPPSPGPTVPERAAPGPDGRPPGTPVPSTPPGSSVIRPPPGIDPEIRVPAPVPDPNTTPVIPPPGTPGGPPGPTPR